MFFFSNRSPHPSIRFSRIGSQLFLFTVCLHLYFCRSVFTRQQQQQQKPFQRLGVDGAIYFYFFSPLFYITILPHWQALICKLKRKNCVAVEACKEVKRSINNIKNESTRFFCSVLSQKKRKSNGGERLLLTHAHTTTIYKVLNFIAIIRVRIGRSAADLKRKKEGKNTR